MTPVFAFPYLALSAFVVAGLVHFLWHAARYCDLFPWNDGDVS